MPDHLSNSAAPRRHLVSSVLSPAVQFWLRSLVEQAEDLHLQILGGDRQILTGHIPRVVASARNVVYQGLHLSQIRVAGSDIRINLGQVLRGKPLRLLAIIPVEGEAVMQAADLNASLQSPLLANAVTEFLLSLLQSTDPDLLESPNEPLNLQNLQVSIALGQLTLSANLVAVSGTITPIVIRTGLQGNGHELRLVAPQWLTHAQAKRGLPLKDLDGFSIDLGSDVEIRELRLEDGQIFCQGEINVIPIDP